MKDFAYKMWSIIPDTVRVPVDIIRKRPQWKMAGVIFIHVPKSAGVSVSRALYGRPLGHFTALDVRRICPITFQELLTFGVVRNPVDRLYSAYRFAKTGGTNEMGMDKPWIYKSKFFDSFEKFVCEWLVYKDVSKLDGVFRPQHLYLCDDHHVIVDEVIKLEQINQGMAELSKLLGRQLEIGHHNKSKEGTMVIKSQMTFDVIEHLYKKDLDIFSYSMERLQ